MKNLAGMMKQAAEMQSKMEQMTERLEKTLVEGQSGAGMVRLSMTGKGDLKSITIDPKLIDPAEIDMLTDLILAAHADAKRRMEVLMKEEMSKVTGGMQLPPGLNLPF